jgi:hypothetical protein
MNGEQHRLVLMTAGHSRSPDRHVDRRPPCVLGIRGLNTAVPTEFDQSFGLRLFL